jgi:hypothetical protein
VRMRHALRNNYLEKRGTPAGAKDLVPIWAFEVHPLNLNVSSGAPNHVIQRRSLNTG